MKREEIEDGMGFSGLVPSLAEKQAEHELNKVRGKIAESQIDREKEELNRVNKLLSEENRKLRMRLDAQRKKMYEAFEQNCHEYTRGYAQRYVDMQEAGLEDKMRSAEKWDRVLAGDAELIEQYTQRTGKAMAVFVRARADLLRITDGLMVDENCKSLAHGVEENEMIPFCSLCDGAGKTSRPAAAPEVREFIEFYFRPAMEPPKTYAFQFSDGRVMRLEETDK